MKKRLLSFFLILALVLSMLASCGESTNPPAGTSGEGSGTTGLVVTTDSPGNGTTGGETDPEPEPIAVSLKRYQIIYAADADQALVKSLEGLNEAAGEKFDLALDLMPDEEVSERERAYEIVVGECDRTITEGVLSELRRGDYLLRYDEESGRILLFGSDLEATIKAVERFTELLLAGSKPEMVFAPTDGYTVFGPATYPIFRYYLDGVDIREYKVIIPATADLLTQYAGQNIVDFFDNYMGITLEMGTDADEETDYEILLGDTNRSESNNTCEPEDGEYVMYLKNGKLVLQGNTYMVGGGFGMLVQDTVDLKAENQVLNVSGFSKTAIARSYVFPTECTNAILMIGDGMGYNHVNMALANGLSAFVAQSLPYYGSAVTRSQSVIDGNAGFTDSAAAATALATGYKTINGMIGQNPAGQNVTNVREVAQAMGAQTAVVTTDVITGATPSGFLAHTSSRGNTADLQAQIDALIEAGKVDYCVGSAGNDLYRHTRAALMEISDSSDPFFIMVEEGYIDKNSHNNDMSAVYDTVVRFNQSIAYAIGFTLCHPGTALIITADHETGGITPSTSNSYGYVFTSTDHTNVDVPVYAIGPGTAAFDATATENIDIARFIAAVFGEEDFGQ